MPARPALAAVVAGTALLFQVGRAGAGPPRPCEVEVVRDVACRDLYDGESATADKNKLDIYIPKGRKGFPVLFFVHGGAWVMGSKERVLWFKYGDVGLCFARHGVGTVMPNYRLSPGVKHPEHVKDVARAFAWTCKNIANYGGRADQIFVGGHSAGAHLVALLATDTTYLEAERIDPKVIRGVLMVSGVYQVYDVAISLLRLPGQEAPLEVKANPFPDIFGRDLQVLKQASPITHVRRGLPPCLVIHAAFDLPGLPKMAEDFAAALEEQRCDVTTYRARLRDHNTVIFSLNQPGDRVAQTMLEFLRRHARAPGKGP